MTNIPWHHHLSSTHDNGQHFKGLKQNHTHQLEHKISVRANKLKPIGANLSTIDRVPQDKLE